MKRSRLIIFIIVLALLCTLAFSTFENSTKKPALKVIIIPKFETGEMSGDFPGEAQLFYEKYCMDCEEIAIPNMPGTGHFCMNEDSGVGILVTGSGKTAAALSLMALLSSGLYDYTDAYIVSVGCGGGNVDMCTLGDLILVTGACDYDLGHHVDVNERENTDTRVMWFGDDSYVDYGYEKMNPELCENVYGLIKDIPLRTTEQAETVMEENFGRSGDDALPSVKPGTALSGDNFWKGEYGHETAKYIADYYNCSDPYMVTEMEEIAIANTAECFDMQSRMISLRVIVNMDVFMDGQTPESLWGDHSAYNEKVENNNSETLDIFEPAMHNLFDVGSVVVDAVLSGEL